MKKSVLGFLMILALSAVPALAATHQYTCVPDKDNQNLTKNIFLTVVKGAEKILLQVGSRTPDEGTLKSDYQIDQDETFNDDSLDETRNTLRSYRYFSGDYPNLGQDPGYNSQVYLSPALTNATAGEMHIVSSGEGIFDEKFDCKRGVSAWAFH